MALSLLFPCKFSLGTLLVQFGKLKLLLVTLALLFPMVAQAGEMNMQVGKIKINRDYRGNTTVNTGKTKLNSRPDISRTRRNVDSVNRSRNINTLRRNCTESNNETVSNQTIKTRGSNQQRTQTNTVSVSCN
ncbi:MAG: hypothetical protein ACK5WC_12890 [Aphanizomenon sp.]|uniref:Uncharacterized protein n=1 Tax=Aphanizomenon flos-aquae LD13 TaxID=1710894 RepID=A0A1B7VVZ0_APHFL|nr:MAG: hypothetical protein AN481_11880 [Aphanizomenon flos-aquae LD13]OBQ31414.1 MAG: hypothetical protein AN483_00745 [Aphanizomenon flos-aquae MDT14a]HCQ20454.1 hypothetical protein [Anabaena sp. UBA12330]